MPAMAASRATRFSETDLPVRAVLTGNSRDICGTKKHPYKLYLNLNGTMLDEFYSVKLHRNLYDSVEDLQADLDACLVH
jgi:hypothetical protein